jgi:hypothetical protein
MRSALGAEPAKAVEEQATACEQQLTRTDGDGGQITDPAFLLFLLQLIKRVDRAESQTAPTSAAISEGSR